MLKPASVLVLFFNGRSGAGYGCDGLDRAINF
jgi:hypothetical protein